MLLVQQSRDTCPLQQLSWLLYQSIKIHHQWFFFSYIKERTKSETLRPLPFCFQMPSGIVIQRSVHAQLSLKPLPVTAVGILIQSSTTIAVPTAGSIPFDGNKRSRTFKSFSVGLTAPIFLTLLQELRWIWEFGRS